MSNVIPISRARGGDRAAAPSASAAPARQVGLQIRRGALGVVRYAVFLVLLSIRGPLRWVSSVVASVSLFGLPVVGLFLSGTHKPLLLGVLLALGLGSAVLLWFYDELLLWLSPRPIILT
ncbi:hypothetical protein [Burkholderia multivorans]|uniref:hypothetical protein n=1 Tax=Burkholderia multivorans TaxID=87883 RepID=UPI0021BDF9F8|nr:hypothetical protein [Burkholderia multivorans]MDR8763808.1 hypothetical protein [Burkholderia multivorans]MDR8775202.1 hypothetical protein [Burkholderia multivorans]MDR8793537.1 hypothetical protein [Burkholderia multivorans]MDR8799226.1 hypothetical protein [Burkholderia multivorans]MDR8804914.1 hypothetical protein [Burkholderia multivorans]